VTSEPSSYRQLIRALLAARGEGRPLDAFVSDERIIGEVESRLAAVANAGELTIVWIGVNEKRVDAVVRAGDDEWRIVFGSADASTVDWLHVFERPPAFDGVANGRAVIINGASGAG